MFLDLDMLLMEWNAEAPCSLEKCRLREMTSLCCAVGQATVCMFSGTRPAGRTSFYVFTEALSLYCIDSYRIECMREHALYQCMHQPAHAQVLHSVGIGEGEEAWRAAMQRNPKRRCWRICHNDTDGLGTSISRKHQ